MEVPRNCRECMYASSCHSWYGGTQCQYRQEITESPKALPYGVVLRAANPKS